MYTDTKPTTYFARDRRVYDGAPCSDIQREEGHARVLKLRMLRADPTAYLTYYPMEGKVMAWHYPNGTSRAPLPVTGIMHDYSQYAFAEAIEVLETLDVNKK